MDSLIAFLSDAEPSRQKLKEMGLDRYVDWQAIQGLKSAGPAQWRSAIQRSLARGLVESSGARHYTIFYITPMGNTAWTYWLVHLSNSFKARDVMMELHWQLANHFSHYLEPDLFTLGYRAESDARAKRQEVIDLGEAHLFDAIASERCRGGLAEKLVPAIYNSATELTFSQWLETIGSSTPATADMVRQALDAGIQAGDIVATSPDGVRRAKGNSLHVGDTLRASAQTTFLYGTR